MEPTGALEVNREHILTSQNMCCKPCYERLSQGANTKPSSSIQPLQVARSPGRSSMPSQPTTNSLGCPQAAHTGGLESFAPSFPYLSHLFSSVLNPSEWVTGLSYWIRFGHKGKKTTRRKKQEFGEGCGWCGVSTLLAKCPDSLFLSGWFVWGQGASDATSLCRPTYTSEDAGLWQGLERKLHFNIFLQLILILLPSAKIWSDYGWFQTPLKEEPH